MSTQVLIIILLLIIATYSLVLYIYRTSHLSSWQQSDTILKPRSRGYLLRLNAQKVSTHVPHGSDWNQKGKEIGRPVQQIGNRQDSSRQ